MALLCALELTEKSRSCANHVSGLIVRNWEGFWPLWCDATAVLAWWRLHLIDCSCTIGTCGWRIFTIGWSAGLLECIPLSSQLEWRDISAILLVKWHDAQLR
jgi:hypothetical protein